MFNGKIHYKLDMFNSYVSLPQGICKGWGNAPNSLTGLRWASFSAALDLAFLFFSSLTASMHCDPGQSTILDPYFCWENYLKLWKLWKTMENCGKLWKTLENYGKLWKTVNC